MLNLLSLVIGSQLLALASHFYLLMHYYPLHLGMSTGMSLCNINQRFDCDSVALSSYASFLSIPMAGWGFAMNFIMLTLLLIGKWELSSNPRKSMITSWLMSAAILLASIVMLALSLTRLNSFCLFCIGTYVFSILTFAGFTYYVMASKQRNDFDLVNFLNVGFLTPWLAVPAMAWTLDQAFLQQYGSEEIAKVVRDAIADWGAAKTQDLNIAPALVKGSANPKMIISEFADFRCGHCKHAAPALAAFTKAHSESVQVRFYNFPLDGACNPAIESSSGASCRLAYAVQCASKLGGSEAGWLMHDRLFQEQFLTQTASSSTAVDKVLKSIAPESVPWTDFSACLDAPETRDAVVAQAKAGKDAGVRGTPSVYVNSKLLPAGQLPRVLNSALDRIMGSN